MKQLFYVPAFLAFASVSVYAQDAADPAAGQDPALESETQLENETQLGGEGQDSGQFGAESQGSSQIPQQFSEADTDGDGQLSIEEAREALPQDVVVVDTNNDGMLNRSELTSAMPELQLEGGEAAEDGAIGEEEYDQIVQSVEEDTGEREV